MSFSVRLRISLVLMIAGICGALANTAEAQNQLNVVRELELKGLFELLVGDEMTVIAADGKEHQLRIQADPTKPIGLSGGNIALNEPAAINVTATVAPTVLQEGMVVSVTCKLGVSGKVEAISSVRLLPIGTAPGGISVDSMPTPATAVDAKIQGQIKSLNTKRLVLSVPRHELAPRQTVSLDPSAITELTYQTSSLRMLRSGDVVDFLRAADLSTGDTVIREIRMELVDKRDNLQLSVDEQLRLKHYRESDIPADRPRQLESANRHFLLTSDISDQQAMILLDKLEAMFDLVANYYGRRPRGQIEVFVVEDMKKWDLSDWDQRVIKKLQQGEGTTVYRRIGSNQQAVVFSVNKHDVVQHEAVHGFCFLTFQGTGPLWYAEGMAEMGQYWKADDVAVLASPAVIGYLRSRPPHPLNSIINATQIEGEFWKAYAWRWALCHFLATNPNYADNFRKLGVTVMKASSRKENRGKSQSAAFQNTYRRQANELTFEYEQFLKHLEAGLRADLCAWEWDYENKVAGTRAIQRKISAARGWQASGAIVKQGETYETRGKGKWKLSAEHAGINANGDADGQGRLIGVILNEDYELSEEFDLGTDPDFTALSDGVLYVRCRERMSQIADNEGEINFAIRKKK